MLSYVKNCESSNNIYMKHQVSLESLRFDSKCKHNSEAATGGVL